jgi:enterochelin esterase family protein
MPEIIHRFRSAALQNERTLWLHPPTDPAAPCHLVIFLDGELYRDHVGAPALIDPLAANSPLAPALAQTLVVYVSHHSEAARWLECPCYPPFAVFIRDELLPWLESQYPRIRISPTNPAPVRLLAGLSYTGLAAAWVAQQAPGSFNRIIAQSGSFWSDDCWLVRHYAEQGTRLPADFYLDVGLRETQENVRHHANVLQAVSQIAGVKKFRDVLLALGHRVKYVEFDGGHSFPGWRSTLPAALTWAFTA